MKNVRVQKRNNENWKQIRLLSFQKIDLLFDHGHPGPNRPISKGTRGQNISPVTNVMKRGSAFDHHNHEHGSTIDIYSIFWCKHKSADGMEMTSIVV